MYVCMYVCVVAFDFRAFISILIIYCVDDRKQVDHFFYKKVGCYGKVWMSSWLCLTCQCLLCRGSVWISISFMMWSSQHIQR